MTTTYPPTCSHGVAWSVPCAACGRGNPQIVWNQPPTIQPDWGRIIDALERIAAALEEPK